jgi:hypothetical protein
VFFFWLAGKHKLSLKETIPTEHFRRLDVGPVPRRVLTRTDGFFSGLDPSLKTRPRRAGNSMPPAARFGPSVRQTPGAFNPHANHAAGVHCHRSATFQSSVGSRAARRTPARSSTRLEHAR